MLQKSKASPIFGLIESPFFPQSESSFHQGTELIFPFASGNTVSPPSSTSELAQHDHLSSYPRQIEVHQHRCYPLTPTLSVKVVHKVVKMRLILLSNFIMKNLKSFTMLCILWDTVTQLII
ncbi:hypothetical protein CR513_53639, partial [Mucuna pruriens]